MTNTISRGAIVTPFVLMWNRLAFCGEIHTAVMDGNSPDSPAEMRAQAYNALVLALRR